MIARGTSAELKASVPGAAVTVIEADLTDEATEALRQSYPNLRATESGVEIEDADVSLDRVVDLLRPLGVTVTSTYRRQASLDDVFVHLTGRQLRE